MTSATASNVIWGKETVVKDNSLFNLRSISKSTFVPIGVLVLLEIEEVFSKTMNPDGWKNILVLPNSKIMLNNILFKLFQKQCTNFTPV